MLFNSFEFILLFLPFVLAVAIALRGRAVVVWVTLASFVFYSFAGHAWFLIPMLITTCVDYVLAKMMARSEVQRRKNVILVVSLACNLGLLGVFKYGRLFSHEGFFASLVLPAGISFYTFQSIGYMIDVWRGECPAEADFWMFAGFITFFPHLVAGPLTRHRQLIPQLKELETNGVVPEWREGISLFCIGLSKKILIGDQLGPIVNHYVRNLGAMGMLDAWLVLLGYAFQIYFDFSGYSDMAIGLGLIFGIRLPRNFDSPYVSRTPREFWTRWHITFSNWVRDYLYVPLALKLNRKNSPAPIFFAAFITMALSGLWHGANWTFAAWGLYQGLLMGITRSWDHWVKPSIQRPLTFLMITLGWVFFRSPDFTTAARWFSTLFGLHGIQNLLTTPDFEWLGAMLVVCFGITQFFKNSNDIAPKFMESVYRQAAIGAAAAAAVLLLNHSEKFLYFQF